MKSFRRSFLIDAAGYFMNKGTPKTLIEAIQNGYMDSMEPEITVADGMLNIRAHVKDFLAQHFSTALVAEDDEATAEKLKALWFKITGEKI